LSDRDKGLLEVERVLGPLVVAAWCYHYIKENFALKFSWSLEPFFWAVARARSKDAYYVALDKLREKSEEAVTWIQA
jgi:hypothetical protein